MARLTAVQRRALPRSAFAVPSKAPGPGSYPIPDAGHAQAAKGRATQFAPPSQRHRIDQKANKLLHKVHKRRKKTLKDSRGDTYTPGARFDSAGDRIMGHVDSRGDRLR